MSRAGDEGGMFLLYHRCCRGMGGDCAIRDQNKGLRLSFVQGLLLTHF